MEVRYTAIVLALNVCMASIAHGETSTKVTRSTLETINHKKLSKMYSPPVTPRALLMNFKYALDHKLLLERNFYTPENLKWFIGKYTTKGNVTCSDVELIFAFESNPEDHSNGCVKSGSISWGDMSKIFEKEFISAVIMCDLKNTEKYDDPEMPAVCREFTADLVIEIFGEPTLISSEIRSDDLRLFWQPTPKYRGPKTHPLGGTCIEYKQQLDGNEVKMRFSTLGNGIVYLFAFGMTNPK